ncbi:ECF transporter S component [Mogibacterium sp. CM50]|uniref:ECF transporter S component n=1 Tax=Mogibacterium sp. CM50 TaxID=936375 RepID=UPI00027C5DAE|nr:ECF transporter S component [Mogibacterium sp. CM50]EJU21144.1 ECF-type riboflavin transporter, S component [Mogibacterium sp. CM50]
MIEINKHTSGSSRSEKSDNTLIFVTTAMMTAMVMIATTFFKIPNAMGYIHLGDGFVLLAAIILQKKYACFAGGVGAGLADIYGGYAVWAPWTLVIKIVMVLIVQLFFDFLTKRASNGKHIAKIAGIPFAELFAYVLAVLWTVSGYYIAQGFISGNWIAPVADVPGNVLQAAVGSIITILVSVTLEKTSLGRSFYYRRSTL